MERKRESRWPRPARRGTCGDSRSHLCYHRLITPQRFLAETNEDHFLDELRLGQKTPDFPNGDARGAFEWEMIRAGADGRKGDAADLVRGSQRETLSITAGQQLIFAVPAIAPD